MAMPQNTTANPKSEDLVKAFHDYAKDEQELALMSKRPRETLSDGTELNNLYLKTNEARQKFTETFIAMGGSQRDAVSITTETARIAWQHNNANDPVAPQVPTLNDIVADANRRKKIAEDNALIDWQQGVVYAPAPQTPHGVWDDPAYKILEQAAATQRAQDAALQVVKPCGIEGGTPCNPPSAPAYAGAKPVPQNTPGKQ